MHLETIRRKGRRSWWIWEIYCAWEAL